MIDFTLAEVVKDLAFVVIGVIAGYWVAAHNSKANKEQIAKVEEKLAEVKSSVEDKIKTS